MARSKLQICMMAAGLLTMLAGCASTVPSSLGSPEPPCDVICHVLRLLDFDQPPPPAPVPQSDAANRHSPVARSKARHSRKAKPDRQARGAESSGAAPSSASVVLPATSPDVRFPAVEQPAAERPAPVSAAALNPNAEEHPLAAIPGSPAITPPWFEPLSPLHLRAGDEGDSRPFP